MKSFLHKFSTPFFLFAGFLVCLCYSCDFPQHYFSSKPDCQNQNEYFNSATIQTEGYPSKTLEVLTNSSPEKFRYFFKTFIDEDNNSYMLTNFRNEQNCFDVIILVDKWDKLAGMKKVNGKAYPKELYDLKWAIENINGKMEVRYLDMHDIID